MFKKGIPFITTLALLVFVAQAPAGPNANAVLSLDLIADGETGNQIDDGVTAGIVSGQGTKIAVEVFAKGVTTPLVGVKIEFEFDTSVLKFDKAENSAFLVVFPDLTGANFANTAHITLPESGFIGRAEFSTIADVTGQEFTLGIKKVTLAQSAVSSDVIITTNVISFNANAMTSPDFDSDGTVGISDFLLFVEQFGLSRGDERYDARYDLDGNGRIGIGDFLIFVDAFGKKVPSSSRIVTIPDANLRTAIEDALGKAISTPITEAEMATLEVLDARNRGIRDLEGLQFATNLTSLSLGRAKAENRYGISPGIFAQVEYLPADEVNEISDVSVLSSLTRLTYLDLHRNNISDIAPLAANTGLGSGDQVDVTGNPLNDASINTHIPALQDKGVDVSFDEIVVAANGDPKIYNGNVFVLPVVEDLVTDQLSMRDYTTRFYEHFDDAFDFLIIWSNLYYREDMVRGYAGVYSSVMNDVQGIGKSFYSHNGNWGSAGKLQGVIHMPDFWGHGVLIHEVMHQWANFVVPTSFGAHWGFSSANGVLGGFDIANLVDHDGGQYSAGWFSPAGSFGNIYGPIELYLAGLIPSEDIPEILVAEDGKWLLNDEDNRVEDDKGHWIFTASRFKTYTIEDIIAEHGPRVPDHLQSQKDFRAAAILLIDEDHPATKEVLETVSRNVSWFSHAGSDEFDQHNFYEATGGRATITMDGLSQFQRRSATKRLVRRSFGTPPPPIVDHWE